MFDAEEVWSASAWTEAIVPKTSLSVGWVEEKAAVGSEEFSVVCHMVRHNQHRGIG